MWYILNEKNEPIKSSIEEYVLWERENPKKKFVKQEYVGEVWVSTVFLGLDHRWDSDVPILWETMIFNGKHDQYQDRYSSLEEAIKGHEIAVNLVKNK